MALSRILLVYYKGFATFHIVSYRLLTNRADMNYGEFNAEYKNKNRCKYYKARNYRRVK